MLAINKTPTYTTSDGKCFADRKLAVSHEIYLKRIENVKALGLDHDLAYLDGRGNDVIKLEDLPELIATHGDAILEALTVKQNRGRKAAQSEVATGAAA